MISRLRNHLLSPQLWIGVGVFCFGLSVVIGYHQDQISANSVLASKVEIPPEVLVQDFIAERHMNMIGQVHFVGEVGRDMATALNVGTANEPNWVTAYPVYPVGPEALPLATQHLVRASGAPRRPMARASAQAHASDLVGLARVSDQPVAVLLGDAQLDGAGMEAIGPGAMGAIVAIMGEKVTGGSIHGMVNDVFAAEGVKLMPEVLVVSAQMDAGGVPASAAALTAWRQALVVAGAIMSGIALMSMFDVIPFLSDRRKKKAAAQVAPVAAFHSVLQPRRVRSRQSARIAGDGAPAKGQGDRSASSFIPN